MRKRENKRERVYNVQYFLAATEPGEPLIVQCGKNVTSHHAQPQPQRPPTKAPPVPKRPGASHRVPPGVPAPPRTPSPTYRPDQELLDMLIKRMHQQRARGGALESESQGAGPQEEIQPIEESQGEGARHQSGGQGVVAQEERGASDAEKTSPQQTHKVPKSTEAPGYRHQLTTTRRRSFGQSTEAPLRPQQPLGHGIPRHNGPQHPLGPSHSQDITKFHRVPSPAFTPTPQSTRGPTSVESTRPQTSVELYPRPLETDVRTDSKASQAPRAPSEHGQQQLPQRRPVIPNNVPETLQPAMPSHGEDLEDRAPKLKEPSEKSRLLEEAKVSETSNLGLPPAQSSENSNLTPTNRTSGNNNFSPTHGHSENNNLPDTHGHSDTNNLPDTHITSKTSHLPSHPKTSEAIDLEPFDKSVETEFYSVDGDSVEELPDSSDLFVPGTKDTKDTEGDVYKDSPGLDHELDSSYVDDYNYPGVVGGNYSRATAPGKKCEGA